MNNHAEAPSLRNLQIDEDVIYDIIYQQASNAFERLLAEQERIQTGRFLHDEPTDHEAEGAMRYVMSRGR